MTAQRRNFQRRRAAFAAVITLSSATRSAFAFTTPQPASSRGSMGGGSATRAAFVAPSHPLRIPAASSLEGLLSSAAAQSGLSSSTSLSMAGAGALAGCLTGGLFAGGLHAIAGPDHLAALLPRCCGQRWYRAGRIGALWGMGHGASATLLGVVAFALKNRISRVGRMNTVLTGASSFMELAVGLSLVFIGIMGMKEAREWSEEIEQSGPAQSLGAAAADDGVKEAQKRAVVVNGILHGFSWDGAPSLAPAIAVATWSGNLTFLLSYATGTMAAMAVTTTIIGEGTRRAGEVLNRPDVPQKLSFFSSVIAMLVGAIWCGLALK